MIISVIQVIYFTFCLKTYKNNMYFFIFDIKISRNTKKNYFKVKKLSKKNIIKLQ